MMQTLLVKWNNFLSENKSQQTFFGEKLVKLLNFHREMAEEAPSLQALSYKLYTYLAHNFQFAGAGSFRTGFNYDEDFIIKLMNLDEDRSAAMNLYEVEAQMITKYPDLFPKTFKLTEDGLLILVEKVQTLAHVGVNDFLSGYFPQFFHDIIINSPVEFPWGYISWDVWKLIAPVIQSLYAQDYKQLAKALQYMFGYDAVHIELNLSFLKDAAKQPNPIQALQNAINMMITLAVPDMLISHNEDEARKRNDFWPYLGQFDLYDTQFIRILEYCREFSAALWDLRPANLGLTFDDDRLVIIDSGRGLRWVRT